MFVIKPQSVIRPYVVLSVLYIHAFNRLFVSFFLIWAAMPAKNLTKTYSV